jgi:RNA polymerase sigma factor (sigma-70 family)
MTTVAVNRVLQQVRRMALAGEQASSDESLLERFVARGDEAAFEALVRRHGPMVLGVCRRVLHHRHDAEDAFQATFLVLARKAGAIRQRHLLGNWLYGVAYRTALEARTIAARRRRKERAMARPEAISPEDLGELRCLLDQELSRLPDRYRTAVLLCDLEGVPRKEAALRLGWPEGTLSCRLARGRQALARRLARRGLDLSAGALAVGLEQAAGPACLPAALVESTVAAAQTSAGASVGLFSATGAVLTEGVLSAMLRTRWTIAAVVLVAVTVLVPAGLLGHRVLADRPATRDAREKPGGKARAKTTEVQGVVKEVDADRGTVTLHPSKEVAGPRTFVVGKDAPVWIADGTGTRTGFRKGGLADLAAGAQLSIRLRGKTVASLWAEGPEVQGTLKAVDAERGTVTVAIVLVKGQPAEDKTFLVAEDARVKIARPVKKGDVKPDKLADLPAGALVDLKLSGDQKTVGGIHAQGQVVRGVIKRVDAKKSTITLGVQEGEEVSEKAFRVARDAPIHAESGKTGKAPELKLAGLTAGALAEVRLSLDGKEVAAILTTGPKVEGVLKTVDAKKGTVTLTVAPKGQPAKDRTFRLAREARVEIDGRASKVADLPTEALVSLQLSPDLATAVALRAEGPTILGVVKGTGAKDGVTIATKTDEQTYSLAGNVRVLIDEAREGKITELIDGSVLSARLSADRKEIVGTIRAEGPSFQGTVKAVDEKGKTVTLTIGAKNGVDGEDKEFKTTKDTAIVTAMLGVARKLSDLRAEQEVVLRLSIDQKAAGRITILGE